MQQHRVVAGFGDREVEQRIVAPLLGAADPPLAQIAVLHALEGGLQALAVGLGCAQRGVIGAGAFERMAEFDQIALGFGVVFEEFDHRVAER